MRHLCFKRHKENTKGTEQWKSQPAVLCFIIPRKEQNDGVCTDLSDVADCPLMIAQGRHREDCTTEDIFNSGFPITVSVTDCQKYLMGHTHMKNKWPLLSLPVDCMMKKVL